MISIYYRHYREDLYNSTSRDPRKKRPNWYTPSVCLHSILRSIESNGLKGEYDLTIWYDGTPKDIESDPLIMVLNRFSGTLSIKVLRYNFRGEGDNSSEKLSFPALINYCLDTHQDDNFVYLIENDYLHSNDSMLALKCWIDSGENFSYITLYDSPDYYRAPIHKNYLGLKKEVAGRSWREVLTATASFLCQTRTLREDAPSFFSFKDFDCFVRLVGLKGRSLFAPQGALASHSMLDSEAEISSLEAILTDYNSSY